ncbi:two-component sensor histidine kinase [Amycolatopsis antarctica]|uniref:histidine kinase n=1 Tax=Amycolatopsis antarctica TaxID=1854586 RepID=A0A263D386_9PSEU|nr:HAMP domain-containing sensor histidine kinase [Amycolatopsis antarctica]OZM72821.1 two-component sensor histidine kinase [Amycolatopsis antarctica]
MRRRLLLVLLAFSLAAVAAFAVPLLDSTAANRTQQFVLSRTTDLDRFTAIAQEVTAGGDRTQLVSEVRAHTGLYAEGVVIVDARRRVIVENGMTSGEPEVAAAIDAALRNQPAVLPTNLRPWSGGDVLFTQPIGTGTRVTGAVVLRSSVAPAAGEITARWALVLLAAAVAAIACVLLVFRLARWVLRPVAQLDDGVRAVTSGRSGAHVDVVAGPAELRGLADSFNRMSEALAESADRQRRLVDDASHQLRTPLAALRLRVDTLAARPGEDGRRHRPLVVELERLESLLDGMLTLASADSTATDLASSEAEPSTCEVVAVLAERVDAWTSAAEAAGSRIEQTVPGSPVFAGCAESELAQVLDVLLDNAIKYAGEGATLRCDCATSGGRVLLVVADDGPGVAEADLGRLTERFWRSGRDRAAPGSGLGLAIADRLVTARGGILRVVPADGGGLEVRVDLPAESGGEAAS